MRLAGVFLFLAFSGLCYGYDSGLTFGIKYDPGGGCICQSLPTASFSKSFENLKYVGQGLKEEPLASQALSPKICPYLSPSINIDYLPSKLKLNNKESFFSFDSIDQNSFLSGFFCGLFEGSVDSLKELLPYYFSIIRSIGEGFWSLLTSPVEFSKKEIRSFKNVVSNLKELLSLETISSIIPELKDLCSKWEKLNYSERGNFVGNAIGSYGMDILTYGGCLKAFNTYKSLKKANALASIERISSAAYKVSIVKEANSYNAVFIDSLEKYKQAK